MTSPATESFTPASAIQDVISSALGQSLVEGGTPEGDLLRDENGRFKPREGTELTPDEGPTDGVPPIQDAKSKEGKDGEAVTLPVADVSKLATQFTLKDAQGELAIPEGLIVEYVANGKTRTDSLDKVVKMAQMGVYNAERVQRTLQIEAQSEEIRSYAEQIEGQLKTRESQLTQLLSDPDYLARAQAEFQAQQTPEKQRERLQRELDESRLEAERAPIRAQGSQYFQREVVPALDMVAKAMPNVTSAEIGKKLHSFVDRLRDPRTGLVHPSQYPQIEGFFRDELIPWARWMDHSRAELNGTPSGQTQQSATAEELAKTKKELEEAKVRAQRAKRASSANLRPSGNRSVPAAQQKKAPVTRDEILEDVIQSTKAAEFGGG